MSMAVSEGEFRRALGCWASGVTVVTTMSGERLHGVTVSAFCSVSLTPPRVLVCIHNRSGIHALIGESGLIGVNILSAGQRHISNQFAKTSADARFDNCAHTIGPAGCPILDAALAALECTVVQAVPAGDHVIYIAEVQRVSVGTRDPLLYFQGDYRELVHGRRESER